MLGSDIQIKQLVGVGNVHLSFQPEQRVYCLIGENGIGKTKCLEALFTAKFCSHRFSNKWVNNLRYTSKPQFIELSSQNIILEFGFKDKPIDPSSQNPLRTSTSIHDMPLVYVSAYSRGYIEDNLNRIQQRKNVDINTFEIRRKDYIEKIVSILKGYNSFKEDQNGISIHEWVVQRAQSANPYQSDEDNREVEIITLLELLNKVDERIDSNFLEISGNNRVFVKIADKKTELSELSSGFASILKIMQSIIAGYSYFTNETNIAHVKGVVFIDEIESHLHTKWQATIIPTLKRLFPNTTFYITTHSAIVLSQLQHGEAYELYRDKTDGVVKTELIEHPNNAAFVDLLKDAFDIDINKLKLARDNAPQQKNAKKMLSELLEKRINELKEGTQ